jgi:DNA-binding transcriptional LysR family regulator
MDTEQARTFLAIVTAGSFAGAADRLNVTPSTVSARIFALEELLGCRLFVRNKAGAVLTASGRQFQKHASTLVRTVAQARQDVGIPRGFQAALTVGGRFGLWEQLLQGWLPAMRQAAPEVSIRGEVGFEDDLMLGLVEGRLDFAVMYTPQSRPGLRVEPLLEEKLVLVSTSRDGGPEPGPGYVHVDWGPEFDAKHSARFPDYAGPALSLNTGWLALQHIMAVGGSGYFQERLVRGLVAEGRLVLHEDAPTFALPAYVVHSADEASKALNLALQTLRRIALEAVDVT